jgi:hypothetical protein
MATSAKYNRWDEDRTDKISCWSTLVEWKQNNHKIRDDDSAMNLHNAFSKHCGFAVLVCAISCLVLLSKWRELLLPADRIVTRAISSVWAAFLLSRVTGAYWINEVEEQGKRLMTYPDADRTLFYRNVIRKFPLEDSNATIFIMTIGDDLKLVGNDLVELQKTPAFNTFSEKERMRVRQWAEEFESLGGKGDKQ